MNANRTAEVVAGITTGGLNQATPRAISATTAMAAMPIHASRIRRPAVAATGRARS